ncbi:MAG: tRNA (adenosine(37)-N6)-threonylcarbamoyltransferase complex ATPase subunit type 1 TsaE [Bacillota bacterium]
MEIIDYENRENKILKLKSDSPAETARLGNYLAKEIDSGQIILLKGELGTGKTFLAQEIIKVLTGDQARSPSYSLINHYSGENLNVYHIDLYRINHIGELNELGIYDLLLEGDILLIEWPEIIMSQLNDYLIIKISGYADNSRILELTAKGEKAKKLIERVKRNVNFRD